MSVRERVLDIVVDTFDLEKDDVHSNAVFDNGLLMDELHHIEFIAALEEEFSMTIQDDDSDRFGGVSDVVEYLEGRMA